MATWQLQEAKSKFSEVVNEAIAHGPQVITRRGTEVAIVLSYSEYRQLQTTQKKLSAFFQESPLAGVELDLSRDRSEVRADMVL
ncbi:type II toxin-antitoxin system prevent-host-death family antitoxin [filamentous cyanobacterium CCP2]|nr:type II toxin-antitoxin system prevent-host-death family antitoxin [filamentous cyanobacterium CCP2]